MDNEAGQIQHDLANDKPPPTTEEDEARALALGQELREFLYSHNQRVESAEFVEPPAPRPKRKARAMKIAKRRTKSRRKK